MQTKHIVPIIVGLLLVGGAAFYGGMTYAKSRPGSSSQNRAMTARNFPGAQMRNAGGFTNGEVISKDENSLTLKLRDGGSKIVFLSASTTVSKMSEGNMDDVAQGSNVMVSGTANQDGSITASMIQIRPENTGGLPAGAPPVSGQMPDAGTR